MHSNSTYISLGKTLKVHSPKGVIKAKLDLPEDFALENLINKPIWLSNQRTLSRLFLLEKLSLHKNLFLVKLAKVNSYQEAEILINQEIFLPKEVILEDSDYFLTQELLGLKVFREEALVGEVIEFIEQNKENQLLRIRLDNQSQTKNFLLPIHKKFILKIDLEQQALFLSEDWSSLVI